MDSFKKKEIAGYLKSSSLYISLDYVMKWRKSLHEMLIIRGKG